MQPCQRCEQPLEAVGKRRRRCGICENDARSGQQRRDTQRYEQCCHQSLRIYVYYTPFKQQVLALCPENIYYNGKGYDEYQRLHTHYHRPHRYAADEHERGGKRRDRDKGADTVGKKYSDDVYYRQDYLCPRVKAVQGGAARKILSERYILQHKFLSLK